MTRLLGIMLLVALPTFSLESPAAAAPGDRCEGGNGVLNVLITCNDGGDGGTPGHGDPTIPTSSGGDSYTIYWVAPACRGNSPGSIEAAECAFFFTCADEMTGRYFIWSREARKTDNGIHLGPWEFLGARCLPLGSEGEHTTEVVPQVTWQMVLSEIRRVGLPAMTVQVQPEGQTLVNFDTIFYAEPTTFTRTLEILGRNVEVEAQPSQFHWIYGDGATETTTEPGAPYPAKTIVHQYIDAHVTVHPSVDAVYAARFRVDGGEWQDIPQTITIPGPPVDLRIREATPVLSGGGGG